MAIRKVLVVDDSKTELLFLTELLQKNGFSVKTAENADDAMRRLEEEQPDLILMDIQLPGMDGIAALLRIREEPALDAVPVVAVSASVMPDDQRHIVSSGFDAYLTKPISLKPFLAMVDRFLKDGRSR